MIIAIDGPAGAGKSTVARALAARLGFTYLDSGAMYRGVALAALRAGTSPDDPGAAAELARASSVGFDNGGVYLDGADVSAEIRSAEVTEAASRVSVHAEVREAMVAQQRELIESGRYVAEGRDIGTVVAPDADLKIFLTADAGERARRRAEESGEDVAAVSSALADRDARDEAREHGALRPAEDSIAIDTSGLSVDEVVGRIADLAVDRGLIE
jgi:cytidylate kinase